jgi:1,4-alpha-glucan branching enzyme
MLCLSLVLEMHHPLPGPADAIGQDWSAAALESYWPVLKALSRFAQEDTGASVTLAVSPSWMALASDFSATGDVLNELNRQASRGQVAESLRSFLKDQWEGDAIALIRQLNASGAVDVITTTSSHTWLPSVMSDPVVARAQVRLAASDHSARVGVFPSGIWLPFLAYSPSLESTIAEVGLRFFAVPADAFLRGTVLPPDQLYAPMVTPPGAAVFGVSPTPTRQVVDPIIGYGRDPMYHESDQVDGLARDHAQHFLTSWRTFALSGLAGLKEKPEPISIAALAASDLGHAWPQGRGGDWLEHVLKSLSTLPGTSAKALGHYLDRHPTGIMGRPGPTAGGLLASRPGGFDLFDRCRAAADLLTYALENQRGFKQLERRTVAHMTRSLLRAQQVDWSLPPGHGIDAETGIRRAMSHLDQFYELAGLLLAGRPDRYLLDRLDKGPAYLPEIDLNLLVGG